MGAREWYLSWPAVSQISNFTVVSSRHTVWVRNAAPMVDCKQMSTPGLAVPVCLPLEIHETVLSQTAELTKTSRLRTLLKKYTVGDRLLTTGFRGPVWYMIFSFTGRKTCSSLPGNTANHWLLNNILPSKTSLNWQILACCPPGRWAAAILEGC